MNTKITFDTSLHMKEFRKGNILRTQYIAPLEQPICGTDIK